MREINKREIMTEINKREIVREIQREIEREIKREINKTEINKRENIASKCEDIQMDSDLVSYFAWLQSLL